MLRAYFITALLLSALAGIMTSGIVQASTDDSISKPSTPEFSVKTASYPYILPTKNTTTIDQYTGKETTYTQPGYTLENKSIEITITNPPFIPYSLNTTKSYSHETGGIHTSEYTRTVNIYYEIGVIGHYGTDSDWTTVGGNYTGAGPQSNAQLDSEYTFISIKADYPNDALLDFRVRTLTGYYVAWGRNVVIFGYDFFGQESNWSNTQTLALNETQTPTPSPDTNPSSGDQQSE